MHERLRRLDQVVILTEGEVNIVRRRRSSSAATTRERPPAQHRQLIESTLALEPGTIGRVDANIAVIVMGGLDGYAIRQAVEDDIRHTS